MHWGCKGIKFKEIDNIKLKEKFNKKNCWMHPGTFDFGHTGFKKVSDAIV